MTKTNVIRSDSMRPMNFMSPDLRYATLNCGDLTEELRIIWQKKQKTNPALYSPYFSVEYTLEVAKLRNDVRVLVAYKGDTIEAFLPIQGRRFARPVGAPMTDYHGLICDADCAINIKDMLAAAGIGVYHFSGLINSYAVTYARTDKVAATDISMGPTAWRAGRDKSYRKNCKDLARRLRKAEAEIGPVRSDHDVRDPQVLETLFKWKREKFMVTGKYDVLSAGWTEALLRNLFARRAPDIRCELHVLYIGETVAAADLGLTDGKTFHSWIVGYDEQFHKYSPGSLLLEQFIDVSVEMGYSKLDLGTGIYGYKKHYSGIDLESQTGMIAATGPAAALSKAYNVAERFGENTALGSLGKLPGKLRRRYSQIAACDQTVKGRATAMVEAIKNARKS